MGAPTKYDDKYCEEIIEFFGIEPYTIVESDYGSVDVRPNTFPTLARFALNINVHRDTIHEWTRRHEKFSDAVKKSKDYQEAFLVEAGLMGVIDKTFAIFACKNILGWNDKGASDFVQINIEDCKTTLQKLERIADLAARGEISITKAKDMADVYKKVNEEDYSEIKDRLDALEQKTGEVNA